MHRLRRPRRYLCAALLALVALGVLLQPILGSLGGLHDLEHAVAAQSDHGHPHHDGHEAPTGDDEAPPDPLGIHALLHQGGHAASMALLDPILVVPSPVPAVDPPDRAHVSGPRAACLTLPFRPPIA